MNLNKPISNASRLEIALEALVPLLILAAGTALFYFTNLDLKISGWFFSSSTGDWWLKKHPIIRLSYVYGPAPSAILAFWALFQLMASYVFPKYMLKRAVAAFVLLAMLFGPIIMVNGIIKESWRRPRPRDIVEFQGENQFKKVLEFNHTGFKGRSFPSGHASSGFVLTLLYFLLKRKKPKLAAVSLALSILYGTWLGVVRIAGGGHFASDTLWAFGANWYVILLLYYAWHNAYEIRLFNKPTFETSTNRYLVASVILLAGVGIISFRFLYSFPFDAYYKPEIVPFPSDIKKIEIKMRAERGDINVYKGKPGEVMFQTWMSGHAMPNFTTDRKLNVVKNDDVWKFEYSIKPNGIYYEYQSHNQLFIPPDVPIKFDLFTEFGSVRRKDLLVR